MKYAYIGSHGTGKSSAAHFLAAKLKKENPTRSVKVIEESVRNIAKIAGINNSNFQKLAILDSLYDQTLYSLTYNTIICDRLPFDYVIYAACHNVVLPPAYIKLAFDNITEFDKIFFVRPDDTPIADDGFRFTDVKERNKIDSVFKEYLDILEVPYEEITTKEIFN